MELLCGQVDFKVVSGFEVGLEVEFTLVLVNVKGLGGGGGRAGALRRPIDSNRSFTLHEKLCDKAMNNRYWSSVLLVLTLVSIERSLCPAAFYKRKPFCPVRHCFIMSCQMKQCQMK